MSTAQEILKFWFEDTPKENWYKSSPELDAAIKNRFLNDYKRAADGKLSDWAETADGGLAVIILLDQFARNMFRGDRQSFAADPIARDFSSRMIESGLDRQIPVKRREFIYMPFLHSEELSDQDRGLELFMTKMDDPNYDVVHAKAHREIIKRFGRFPYRNDAFGRKTTQEEQSFLDGGGYAAILKQFQS